MGRGLRFIEARLLPRGWLDLIRQILLFGGALLVYDFVRGLVSDGNPYKPFGDATRIIDIERTLHVFIEPSIQEWAMNKHWLMDGVDWTYLNAHFIVTFAVLAFIYLRRNDSFYFVRNMFMIAMAIALVGYWLYPTAPPRLMPEWGFTDAISQFVTGGTGSIDFGPTKEFVNFYAAVPSMHVCFAVMIGGRCMARVLAPGQDPVGAVPVADHLRGHRDRQPLPHRRLPRGRHRRRIRAAGAEAARAGQAGRVGVRPDPGRPPDDGRAFPVDRLTMPEQTQRPRAELGSRPTRPHPPVRAAPDPRGADPPRRS